MCLTRENSFHSVNSCPQALMQLAYCARYSSGVPQPLKRGCSMGVGAETPLPLLQLHAHSKWPTIRLIKCTNDSDSSLMQSLH